MHVFVSLFELCVNSSCLPVWAYGPFTHLHLRYRSRYPCTTFVVMSNEGHDPVVGRCEGFFSLKLEIPSVFDFQNFNRVPDEVISLIHLTSKGYKEGQLIFGQALLPSVRLGLCAIL